MGSGSSRPSSRGSSTAARNSTASSSSAAARRLRHRRFPSQTFSRPPPFHQETLDWLTELGGGWTLPQMQLYPNTRLATSDSTEASSSSSSVQNTTLAIEYAVIVRLIREGQLAPFFRGFGDSRELERFLQSEQDPAPAATLNESTLDSAKSTAAVPVVAPETYRQLYQQNAVECPICFLLYPEKINRTRCCAQPICTECFMQFHRSTEGLPALCPFCMEPQFAVLYASTGITTARKTSSSTPKKSIGSRRSSTASRGQQGAKEETGSMVHWKEEEHVLDRLVDTDDLYPVLTQKLEEQQRAAAQIAQRASELIARQHRSAQRHARDPPADVLAFAMGGIADEVEEMMLQEAMRQSVIEDEERQQRDRERERAEKALKRLQMEQRLGQNETVDSNQQASVSSQSGSEMPSVVASTAASADPDRPAPSDPRPPANQNSLQNDTSK